MLPNSKQGEALPTPVQPLPLQKAVDASRYEAVTRLHMPDAVLGMVFVGVTPTGHQVSVDVSTADGGTASAPEPLDLLLVALGSCTGLDVISIMRKKRQRVTSYVVNVYANRATEHPKTYTEIVVEHIIQGDGIDPKAVARSIELSVTKYCPVNALLARATRVEHVYRVDSG